ncbi:MAG TPA: RNA polymerase sigma factor RpoE [Burkholderiaceae bacterium]|nr:RNA polymerase sigma factor RpoE [Burkholderiaceae bacterium]
MAKVDVDSALVERVKRGDREAFGLLVSKYQRRIFRLLSRFIRDPAEVEDVAQEAFIKAYRALPGFRGESAFYTWLYRIAINAAKNWLSAKRLVPLPVNAEGDADEDWALAMNTAQNETPESLLASRQVGEAIGRAVAQLPEELATAIQLREIDGLSYEEIAQVMQCPVGTVRSRLFRAREAIAAHMRPLIDAPKDRRW